MSGRDDGGDAMRGLVWGMLASALIMVAIVALILLVIAVTI